jgi:hypothetical protein
VAVAQTDIDKAQHVRDIYRLAYNARKQRVDMWQRNYRLLHNKAWSDMRESWMPSPAASEIYPIVSALIGWMTDQRPGFTFIQSTDPFSDHSQIMSKLAKDLETCVQATWIVNQFDGEIEKVLWDAMIYGTGFFKALWDASLTEGAGDAVMRRVDPFTMYPDPDATSTEDMNYILEVRNVTLTELERRFPGSVAMLGDELPMDKGIDERDRLYEGSNGQAKANPGGLSGESPRWGRPGHANDKAPSASDELVTLYEAWTRDSTMWSNDEGEPHIEDRWHVTVVCGNHVLLDEDAVDLFGHGRHPYTRYTMQDLGDFWGISLVEHLGPLQLSINRLLAALQSHAELTGNPVFVEDARSGIPRTKITNKPGQRLVKNQGSEVAWLTPPAMSGEVLQLVQFYLGEMERVSGLSAIVRGATPTGRNAQGVLDSVQESAFVRVRLALRGLERTLKDTVQLVASLVVENYTEPRFVSIVGPTGSQSVASLKQQHFYIPTDTPDGELAPMRFQLWVQAGSMFPISRSARAQEADVLFGMGAIDEQAVLEAHDWPNRDIIIERVRGLKGSGLLEPPGARQRR